MMVTSEFLRVLSAFLLQIISETFRVQDNLLICRNTFNWFSMSKVDWFLLTSPYSFASYTFNKYIEITQITLHVEIYYLIEYWLWQRVSKFGGASYFYIILKFGLPWILVILVFLCNKLYIPLTLLSVVSVGNCNVN